MRRRRGRESLNVACIQTNAEAVLLFLSTPQEEPIQQLVRAALRPSRSSQLRIRRDLRASVREVRKEGRYRIVSSHRSSGTSSSLEPQCVSEAAGDAGFQLLDLVHEEGDPEAAATDCCKVSTLSLLCSQRQQLRDNIHLKLKDG